MKSQGSFEMWVILVTSFIATFNETGKPKAFFVQKHHRFTQKRFIL